MPVVPEGTKIEILTPTQMLQRLPVAFVQVKGGKTSENVLNEITLNHIFFVLTKRNH